MTAFTESVVEQAVLACMSDLVQAVIAICRGHNLEIDSVNALSVACYQV